MTTSIYTIYKARNIINDKVYIGFDSKYPNRENVHKSASKNIKNNSKFYRSIRKYGFEYFDWCVIYQSYERDHTLNVMEKYFITEYDSYNSGYNSTVGGDGCFGLKLSEESRKRISEGNKVPKPQTKEHIVKRIAVGIKTRKNRKDSGKSYALSNDTKKKISLSTKGKSKPMSEEHKRNLGVHKLNAKIISCPHCDKIGQYSNMKRWHFDNCKYDK